MTSISDQNLFPGAQKQHKNVSRSPTNTAMASALTKGKPKYSDMACFVTKSNPNYPDMSYASTKEHMGSVLTKDLTRSVLAKDHVSSSVLFTKDQMGVSPLTTENMEPSVLTKDFMGSSYLTKEVDNSDPLTKPSLDMASALRSENPSPCPRCQSLDTKFCYFNNYNAKQPRHFCKSCQRYWTAGGSLRNLPVGAGKRKHKSSSTSTTSAAAMMKKSQKYEIGEDGDCDDGVTLLMKSQRCTNIDDNDDLRPVMNAQRCEIVDDEDDDLGEVISAEASSSSYNKIMRSVKHYHHHHLPNGEISSGFGSNNREVSPVVPGIHGFSSFSSASCGTMSNTHDISQEKEVEEALRRPSVHSFSLTDHKDAPSSQKGEISGQETKALCVSISPDSHMDSDSEASTSAPQPSSTISPSSHSLSPWGAQPFLAPWPWPTPSFNSNDASVAFAHASASFWPFSPPMWTPFGWSSVPWNVVMNASNNNNSASTVEYHENRGQQQDTLCTPKTLKIGDPDEVMHSSILTTLGLMNVASPVSVSSFFNADSHAKLDDSNQKLGGIQDHPGQPIEVEKILYTNPAALARSLAFKEGK